MRGKRFMAISLACATACVTTCACAGDAAPSGPPAECVAPVSAIGAVRKKIDAGRDVLSADEADCAFLEFANGGASGDRCREIKTRANPDARRAWGEIQQGWDALGRLRLDLRKLEDRLGVECEEP